MLHRSPSPSSTSSCSSSGIATPDHAFGCSSDPHHLHKQQQPHNPPPSFFSGPPQNGQLSAFDLLLSAASTMDPLDRTPSPPVSLQQQQQQQQQAGVPAQAAAAHTTSSAAAQPAGPAPPALSTARFPPAPSSTTSSTSSSSNSDTKMLSADSRSSSGEESVIRPEDLTSKGKKRKRLAKACSGLPQKQATLLCEFSGRECIYLSSSGQRVSAPRSTRPSPKVSNPDGTSDPVAGPGPSSINATRKRTKSLVDDILKPNPLSMSSSTLSDGFFAARSASLASLSASSAGSTSSPAPQSSPVWDGRTQTVRSSSRMDSELKASLSSSTALTGRDFVVDPLLKRSLVKSFFEHFAEPLASIFHKPTFYASLYTDQVSPLLLNAIFAWSARFSSHPLLVEISPERRFRGEPFANNVRAVVEQPEWVEEVLKGSDAVSAEEELERAQALVLLTVYESLMRRGTKTIKSLDLLVPFVTRLTQQDNPPPPPTGQPPTRAESTARELRSRLFWTTYVMAASLEAQSGRSLSHGGPKGFNSQDCRLALPMSDDRFEMGACGEGLRSDGLTHPEGGPSKMLISELGHLARVQRIFRDIMSSVSDSPVPRSPRMGGSNQPVDHEASLKTWAQTLPSGLQFNEVNLKAAVDRIHHRPVGDGALAEESTGPGGDSGHAFAVLHTAAEVAMFFQLQTVRTTRPVDHAQDQYLARRQSQAIENIVFVLNAVGEKGRQNPCLFFPLYIVSKWKAQSKRLQASDSNVATWWAETGLLWGFDLDVILDRGFIDITPHSSPPTTARPVLERQDSVSSLGSVAMSATSSGGPPPYSMATLPSPLERVPSFGDRLPSIQTLQSTSQSMTGISLPSPSSFPAGQLPLLPSPGVYSQALGPPSFRRTSISDAGALPSFPLQQNLTPSPNHGYSLPAPFSSLNRQRSASNASSTHTVTGP